MLDQGTFWASILVLEPSSSSSSSCCLACNWVWVGEAENGDRKELGFRDVERERERGGRGLVKEIGRVGLWVRERDLWVENKWGENGRHRI